MLDINSDDIARPDAVSLPKIMTDLEAATAGTTLPLFFTLNIPVFVGEPKVDVKVLTNGNQDCNAGKIYLGLELVRTRIIIETEFARIAREIASATSVPVVLGSIRD